VTRHLLKLVWNRKRASALIVAEIFFSFLVVLAVLTGASTFLSNWREPLGFDWKNVLVVSFDVVDRARGGTSKELHANVMRLIDEARAMPEVQAAGLAMTPPYAFSTGESTQDWRGREVSYTFDEVTDGYGEAMQLQVLKGRWFQPSDDAAAEVAVVLDATLARAFFGDEDPVGQVMEEKPRPLRVVGVVAPFRKDGETTAPMQMMFRRYPLNGAYGHPGANLVVRLHPGTPPAFEQRLVEQLQKVAPDMALSARTMEQMRERMTRMRLAPLVIGGVIGTFLIAMVALGLTGVLWQNVTRRTRELGLRRAMGASSGSVHRQVLAEVVLLATIALVLGSIVALQLPILGVLELVTRDAFVFGFIGALATIYALTVLCGLYPSWLASRLQPADALRYE
jgi:putative ABC transport system permease protein